MSKAVENSFCGSASVTRLPAGTILRSTSLDSTLQQWRLRFTLFPRLAYIYGEGAVRQASAKRTLRRTPPQQSARAETLMKLLLASLLGRVYHYAETDPAIQRRRRTPGQDYGAAPETLAGTRVDCPRRPPH